MAAWTPFVIALIERLGEHAARYVGVANGYAVGAAAEEHRELGEVEDAAFGTCKAGQDARALAAEDAFDEVFREAVVSGVYGRVRREYALLPDAVERLHSLIAPRSWARACSWRSSRVRRLEWPSFIW